jgi:hypothetical protein
MVVMKTLFTHRSRCLASLAWLLALAGCGGGGGGSSATASSPVGSTQTGLVYVLLDPGASTTTAQHFAAMGSVDGLAFRDRWSQMETSPGSYNWSRLDGISDVARQAGKRLSVHIAADAPAWLSAQGVQFYTYTNQPGIGSGSAPIPWDATYLGRHASFVQALANHLRSRGDDDLLRMVSVGSPVSEMSLPACANGILGDNTAYVRSTYLQAWGSSISSHQAAFPKSLFQNVQLVVSAPVAQICRTDNDGSTFYTDLMVSRVGSDDRLGVFMADLNAVGSARLGQVDAALRAQVKLNFQTIWSATNDPHQRFQGTLLQAACQSWRAGARYIELYQADLDNTASDTPAAVAAARNGTGC